MGTPAAETLCITIGLFIYACAVRDVRLVRRLRREGLRTEGLVVANIADRRDESTAQTPVIRFHDHRGYMVEFKTAIQGIGMGLATGRRVGVVYLPDSSHKARVDMRRQLVGPAVGMILVGTLFLGLGLLVAFI